MDDLVRVRLDNGSEVNVSPAWAKRHNLEALDEPAQTAYRQPRRETRNGRRPKPKTTVAEQATAKKADTKTADDHEEKRR